MKTFQKEFVEQSFDIPELTGISKKAIEAHLKLYAGYVKNTNTLLEGANYDRRFPFEFNGMRNHEIYFKHFIGGPNPMKEDSEISKLGFDLEKFKELALTRGVGWAMLYYDPASDQLIQSWVDEQHLGQLNGLSPILALDMWEHAFLFDFPTGDKKAYIEAFFANLNWQNVLENLSNAKA